MYSDLDLLLEIRRLKARRADDVQLYSQLSQSAPLKQTIEQRIAGYDQRIMDLLGGPENADTTIKRLNRLQLKIEDAQEKAAKERYKATQWERDIDGISKGLLLIVVAGLISLITYLVADPGGSYIIMSGALVIGGLMMAKGVLRLIWLLILFLIDRKRRPENTVTQASIEQ